MTKLSGRHAAELLVATLLSLVGPSHQTLSYANAWSGALDHNGLGTGSWVFGAASDDNTANCRVAYDVLAGRGVAAILGDTANCFHTWYSDFDDPSRDCAGGVTYQFPSGHGSYATSTATNVATKCMKICCGGTTDPQNGVQTVIPMSADVGPDYTLYQPSTKSAYARDCQSAVNKIYTDLNADVNKEYGLNHVAKSSGTCTVFVGGTQTTTVSAMTTLDVLLGGIINVAASQLEQNNHAYIDGKAYHIDDPNSVYVEIKHS